MVEHPAAQFMRTLEQWGLSLNDAQLAAFALYADALTDWNQRINLTAITRPDEIYLRHFLDSLSCALHWGALPRNLIDIGSGAGFPGLPLKILQPDLQLTLLESVTKKAAFLDHICSLLGLQNVTVLVMRAEQAGRDPAYRGQYDVATARAVAELRILVEYALPLLRVGGRLLAPKGAAAYNEVNDAARALTLLGGELMAIQPVLLPGFDERRIVIVEKVTPTNERFPRPAGMPGRRPL